MGARTGRQAESLLNKCGLADALGANDSDIDLGQRFLQLQTRWLAMELFGVGEITDPAQSEQRREAPRISRPTREMDSLLYIPRDWATNGGIGLLWQRPQHRLLRPHPARARVVVVVVVVWTCGQRLRGRLLRQIWTGDATATATATWNRASPGAATGSAARACGRA